MDVATLKTIECSGLIFCWLGVKVGGGLNF